MVTLHYILSRSTLLHSIITDCLGGLEKDELPRILFSSPSLICWLVYSVMNACMSLDMLVEYLLPALACTSILSEVAKQRLPS